MASEFPSSDGAEKAGSSLWKDSDAASGLSRKSPRLTGSVHAHGRKTPQQELLSLAQGVSESCISALMQR